MIRCCCKVWMECNSFLHSRALPTNYKWDCHVIYTWQARRGFTCWTAKSGSFLLTEHLVDSKAFRFGNFECSLLVCIWQIHYTQLLTEWAAKIKIGDRRSHGETNTQTRVISSPLPPCHSMSHWSSCHVCRSWPGKGRRWTWPSWQSSSGCQCRNPYSNALCRSPTPSSDCCVDTWTNNYLIKYALLSELAWIVIMIWCIWHCHSHADEVWTDSTSGSVQLPWEINIIHKQNLGSCQVFSFHFYFGQFCRR